MSGLNKQKKLLMQSQIPINKTQEADLTYKEEFKVDEEVPVIVKVELTKTSNCIDKKNSTKSIKVPTIIHTEINLLGSFIDENKTYEILQKLIDSYVQNELTYRQRRQFEFIVQAFNEKK